MLVLSAGPNDTLGALRLLSLERATVLLLKGINCGAHGTYTSATLCALLGLLSGILPLIQLFTDQPLKLAVLLGLLDAPWILVYGPLA